MSSTAPHGGDGVPCGACGRVLPLDDFYPGNATTCRRCVKLRAAARRRGDPAAQREANRRWRQRERDRQALLEHVLRLVAVRLPDIFCDAVRDAEDALALPPGTALELFARRKPREFSSG
ncbi:hypothetical protein [Actinoallomurus sp. CA-150999]|uniref:hypothetical protein n=1 Tax=Actinoallomurus sp. CA-150999 TaxID=3239887 RepID=UPI003D8C803D